MAEKSSAFDDEIKALGEVLDALALLKVPQQEFVLRAAADRLNLNLWGRSSTAGPGWASASESAGGVAAAGSGATQSPKQFVLHRRPANDVQHVATLAYYLTHHRSQPHFKTGDLTKLNIEAAGPKIGNPSQAVANATKISGYLAAVGGGKKQITTLGEQVVAALPDQEAVRRVLSDHSTSRRKKRRKRDKSKGKAGSFS